MTALHLSLNVPDLAHAVERYRALLDVEPAKRESDYAKFETDGLVLSLVPGSFTGPPLSFGLGDAPPQRPVVPETGVVETPKVAEWDHFIGAAWPDMLPANLDSVQLTGTFNGQLADEARVLSEVFAALKTGGVIRIHALMSDRSIPAVPDLPGPAAIVRTIPVLKELLERLTNAGFADVRIVQYPPVPWLVLDGAELREIKLEARKPLKLTCECVAVYRGPFAWVTLAGCAFRRCDPVRIDAATRGALPSAHFDFVELP